MVQFEYFVNIDFSIKAKGIIIKVLFQFRLWVWKFSPIVCDVLTTNDWHKSIRTIINLVFTREAVNNARLIPKVLRLSLMDFQDLNSSSHLLLITFPILSSRAKQCHLLKNRYKYRKRTRKNYRILQILNVKFSQNGQK